MIPSSAQAVHFPELSILTDDIAISCSRTDGTAYKQATSFSDPIEGGTGFHHCNDTGKDPFEDLFDMSRMFLLPKRPIM